MYSPNHNNSASAAWRYWAELAVRSLSYISGLSDDVRADFTVMKDVAVHTRIAPAGRQKTLLDFVQQMNRSVFLLCLIFAQVPFLLTHLS